MASTCRGSHTSRQKPSGRMRHPRVATGLGVGRHRLRHLHAGCRRSRKVPYFRLHTLAGLESEQPDETHRQDFSERTHINLLQRCRVRHRGVRRKLASPPPLRVLTTQEGSRLPHLPLPWSFEMQGHKHSVSSRSYKLSNNQPWLVQDF